MKVVFFHRKRYLGVHSIEIVFSQVRKHLSSDIVPVYKELRFISQGFFKRLYISIQAAFNQGDINHITGDINFISFFLVSRKTILTIHDVGYMNHKSKLMRFFLLWFWIRLPIRKCAIITTVSNATKLEVMRFVEVDPNRIKVIHDPISEEFSHIPKKFNKEKPNILQLGTKENKNLIMLIRALKGISCNLQIIGTLSERQVAELKENEITYEANSELTDEEIRIKYSQCDIVSFVSTYEGFGMPIVEANAIGRVVVTSNILSMPEVGADAAHFVDPFDVESIRTGIIRVINDDHYRDKLIANGFVNRNRFDPRSIAKQYSEIYKALVDHRKMR